MYFNFCFCFFAWYPYRDYEFCNRIKNVCNSCIEKKNNNEIVLLTKPKLNGTEVVISKALIYSNISHDGFVLINNVLKEYDKIQNLRNQKTKI